MESRVFNANQEEKIIRLMKMVFNILTSSADVNILEMCSGGNVFLGLFL